MTGTTIGIAIAVPEPYGTMLRRARRSFGDVQADVIPTHITLLPPGPIEDGGLPLVLEHLARVAAGTAPFDVVLRGTGTFRPVSPVVFVCVAEGAQECAALAAGVRSGPLDRPLDFAYHPHVTVAHHLDDAALDRAQAELARVDTAFVVHELVLYAREGEGEWERLWGFELTGDARPTEQDPADPAAFDA